MAHNESQSHFCESVTRHNTYDSCLSLHLTSCRSSRNAKLILLIFRIIGAFVADFVCMICSHLELREKIPILIFTIREIAFC